MKIDEPKTPYEFKDEEHKNYIAQETLANDILLVKSFDQAQIKKVISYDIDGNNFQLVITC